MQVSGGNFSVKLSNKETFVLTFVKTIACVQKHKKVISLSFWLRTIIDHDERPIMSWWAQKRFSIKGDLPCGRRSIVLVRWLVVILASSSETATSTVSVVTIEKDFVVQISSPMPCNCSAQNFCPLRSGNGGSQECE